MANHLTAYLFDDVHTNFGDLAQARDAARKQITDTLQLTDRVAILSTSGQTTLDFTDDRDAIQATLLRLQPRPRTRMANDCPDISYYMADLIQNKNDASALNAATLETMSCSSMTPDQRNMAESMARSTAGIKINSGDYETRLALSTLKAAIRRISAMPGQRTLVLVSSGFLLLVDHRTEETDLMDQAIRTNVTINTLDARGLYAPPGFDASQRGSSAQVQIAKAQYQRESAQVEGEVLGELADATGGTWFHNRNDLGQGFRLVAASPEFTYVLGFSPQNLKYDGSFHALKVTLKTPSGLGLQSRRGYYAPKHQVDPNEQAKEEVREALFSREEMKDIPVNLQTQFFKSSDINAKLSVLAHVDLKVIRFRKAEGRNRNSLTVVSAIFDRNGILINAIQKTIDMFLKDETFVARTAAGLTVKTSFDVTPGNYVIRLVVRDTEGQMMTAQNGVVQIP
jgi:VWFA-related protein